MSNICVTPLFHVSTYLSCQFISSLIFFCCSPFFSSCPRLLPLLILEMCNYSCDPTGIKQCRKPWCAYPSDCCVGSSSSANQGAKTSLVKVVPRLLAFLHCDGLHAAGVRYFKTIIFTLSLSFCLYFPYQSVMMSIFLSFTFLNFFLFLLQDYGLLNGTWPFVILPSRLLSYSLEPSIALK